MIRNCDFILPFFVSQEARTGPTTSPYDGQDGYIYATNAAAVIRVPKENTSGKYVSPDGFPNVKKMFDMAINAPGSHTATIEYADFLAALTGGDRPAFLRIGAQTFAIPHLRTIFAMSVFTGAERITYRADDGPHSPALFEIGDGITILLFSTNLRGVQAEMVKLSLP